MKRKQFKHFKSYNRQQGAVLVIGMIFLVLLTLIGLNSISDTELQERMAGNLSDRHSAFQSAEAALRYAEELLAKNEITPFDGSKNGYWPDLNIEANLTALKNGNLINVESTPPSWTEQQWQSYGLALPEGTISNVKEQPIYVLEEMTFADLAATQGSAIDVESMERFAVSDYYRVTARGVGMSGTSVVVLQTTYIP